MGKTQGTRDGESPDIGKTLWLGCDSKDVGWYNGDPMRDRQVDMGK